MAGLALLVVLAILAVGCGDQETSQPPSLDSPSAMAMAVRAECGSSAPALQGFQEGNRCAIGLIANANSDRLAVTDLGAREPGLADLDGTVPGVTHLEVGAHPSDVAASSDGTVAYTLNTVDQDLSVVDLWRLELREETLELPGDPKALATAPGEPEGGYLAVAIQGPNALWLRPGIHCEQSGGEEEACSGFDAEPTQIPLPGRPSDVEISTDGELAYLLYADRNYMSVVALPDSNVVADNSMLACRGGRSEAPCEANRIGLTYGCSDGVDSDGDGLADTEDPQCWGPQGAEAPGGVGRSYVGACADGEDNDGDGEVDREDPDCQSNADGSESEPLSEDASFACSDGEDNDGDGLVDYPEDPDCYGPTGRRESSLEVTGFESLAVDGTGTFVYVLDPSDGQVLTVDARRQQLVDAPASTSPSGAAFTDQLGMVVGGRPLAAGGFVGRSIVWQDPDDPAHGIVRHEFGVHVASESGRMTTLRTVSSDCEVRETERSELLSNREFHADSGALRESNERHCLTLPEFPIDKPDEPADAEIAPCPDVRTCRTCRESEEDGESMGEECDEACADFEAKQRACRRLAGRLVEPTDEVRLLANPRFAPGDTDGTDGRLSGSGTCTAPSVFLQQMEQFVGDNPDEPSVFGCSSSHRDQPVSGEATDEQLEEEPTFDEIPRAELLQYVRGRLAPPADAPEGVQQTYTSRPYDFRYRSEEWTVTWEGVLPETDRDDGLLVGDEEGVLDTDGLDVCRAGVREGDRIVIANSPETGGEAPERCGDFEPPERDDGGGQPRPANDPFLTYRVEAVRANTLELAPIEEEGEDERYADDLPVRECFPTSIRYEVRAEDEWTVVGEESGFASDRTSSLGQCVPRHGADQPRVQSRVETDESFLGPYLGFELYDGPVDPIRRRDTEFSYTFDTQRFYSPERSGLGTIMPSDLLTTGRVGGGNKLLVSDAADDFVVILNLTDPYDNPVRLR